MSETFASLLHEADMVRANMDTIRAQAPKRVAVGDMGLGYDRVESPLKSPIEDIWYLIRYSPRAAIGIVDFGLGSLIKRLR